MSREIKFVTRFSLEEKRLLIQVAGQMRRTQSDTLRVLVLEKAEELGLKQKLTCPELYRAQQEIISSER